MNYFKRVLIAAYSLLNGMAVTLKYWLTWDRPDLYEPADKTRFPRKFTVQYPKERHWVPDIERGPMVLLRDGEGKEKCNGCGICAMVCTGNCIDVARDKDADGKFYVKKYDVDFANCVYCNLCVEYCPQKALRNTPTYEWGYYTREDLLFNKDKMTQDEKDTSFRYPSIIKIPKQ